jgi:rod shape-determining protein MreD
MMAGFAGGLLFDLVGTGPIGPGAFVFCLVAYLAGSLKENTFAEGWSVPLVVLLLGGLVAETAYGSTLAFLGEGEMSLRAFFTVAVPSALYNVGVAVFIYPWLARFLREERSVTMFRRLS